MRRVDTRISLTNLHEVAGACIQLDRFVLSPTSQEYIIPRLWFHGSIVEISLVLD